MYLCAWMAVAGRDGPAMTCPSCTENCLFRGLMDGCEVEAEVETEAEGDTKRCVRRFPARRFPFDHILALVGMTRDPTQLQSAISATEPCWRDQSGAAKR